MGRSGGALYLSGAPPQLPLRTRLGSSTTRPRSRRPASGSRLCKEAGPHELPPNHPVLSPDVSPAAQRRRGQLLPACGPGEGLLCRLASKPGLPAHRAGATYGNLQCAQSLRAAHVQVTRAQEPRL